MLFHLAKHFRIHTVLNVFMRFAELGPKFFSLIPNRTGFNPEEMKADNTASEKSGDEM